MNLSEIIDKSAGKGNEVSELTRKILSLLLEENPSMAVAAKALELAHGEIIFLSSKAPISECVREPDAYYPHMLAKWQDE